MLHLGGVDHIGVAVASIDEQRAYYEETLGMRLESSELLPQHGVRVAFFASRDHATGVRIELLEPISPESTIARHLQRRGQGLHHIAYAVSELDEALAALRATGIKLIDETPRLGAGGHRIAFVHPTSTFGVLTELCEILPHDDGD